MVKSLSVQPDNRVRNGDSLYITITYEASYIAYNCVPDCSWYNYI